MMFVKSRAEGGPTAVDVENALAVMPDVVIRVGEMPPGEHAFPIRIALLDSSEFRVPGKPGEERFRDAAERVVATLAQDKDVAAPAAFPRLAPQNAIDVDRDQCAKYGVALDDLFTTLQTSLGGVYATEFYKFGQTYPVTVQTSPVFTEQPEDLTSLWVGGADGEMISLDKLIRVRKSTEPTAMVRINGYRAIIVNAAPRSGKSPAEIAARCVRLAEEALPREYRAMNLTGP